MARTDFVIIGGGVSGTTAAETLRERDAHAAIALIEDEPYPLYSRVLIPKYLKNGISRENLFLRKIGDYAAKKIDFYSGVKVSGLDPERHEVYTADGKIFTYKKLLISAGGRPEIFLKEALRMHTLEDADRIKEAMEKSKTKEAVVVGESFIAMEFIEIFLENGFKAHALAKKSFFGETRLGETGGIFFEENLKRHGVLVHKNTELKELNIKTDLIGAGVGLKRNLELFSGLEVGNGIFTNEFLEASQPDIYASGDIAEYFDVIAAGRETVGNWTSAFLQGKVAAANMFGERLPFKAVPTYNIVHLGLNLTFVGYLTDADYYWEKLDGGSFIRVFLRGDKIRGGVLINRFKDKPILARLIESAKNINTDELEKIFS